MTNGKRASTNRRNKNKQHNNHASSPPKGMRERVISRRKRRTGKPSPPTVATTKARAILCALGFAGIVFLGFAAHALWTDNKAMTAEVWSLARYVVTGIVGWAIGQVRA